MCRAQAMSCKSSWVSDSTGTPDEVRANSVRQDSAVYRYGRGVKLHSLVINLRTRK